MLKAENGRDEEAESGIAEVDMDIGDGEEGSTTCTKHPNNHSSNNNPGGICAFCLQEKLGNLVSSSAAFPPSTTCFRSESTGIFGHSMSTNNAHQRKPRIPFLSSSSNKNANATSLQRSKSTAATSSFQDGQQMRRSFWSFLYYSKRGGSSNMSSANSSNRVGVGVSSGTTPSATTRASSVRQGTISIAEDEEEDDANCPGQRQDPRSHTHTAAEKVSRSRSVGCGGRGSRSLSGDFFERLGDCTIRRVESHRQSNVAASVVDQQQHHKGIKERVRCGGIFGGFNLTSSSSSQCVTSTTTAAEEATNSSKTTGSSSMAMGKGGQMVHGRSRSWAWALASPLRALGKPTTSTPSSSSSNNRLPQSVLSVSG